jgi:hypothetical protein
MGTLLLSLRLEQRSRQSRLANDAQQRSLTNGGMQRDWDGDAWFLPCAFALSCDYRADGLR